MEHRWADSVRGVPGEDKPSWLWTPSGVPGVPGWLWTPSSTRQPSIPSPIPQRRRSTYGRLWSHTSLPWCSTNPCCSGRIPFTMRQSIPVYTSYTENSVWPHFESILPGVPPPTQPPKNTTTTHADAPHYQSPPLIREIRKVGDVFTATFTLSPFPPIIISDIDLSLYSCDPLRKWFHISLNLLPTMSKEGFGSH